MRIKNYLYFFQPLFWSGLVIPLVIGMVAGTELLSFSGAIKFMLAILSFLLISAGTQAVNDVYDLKIDRINKPFRPLPSGKATKKGFLVFAFITYAISLIFALLVNLNFFLLTLSILLLNHFYAAPFFRFKKHAITEHLSIFLFLGLLPTIAGYLVFQSFIPWVVWLLAIAVGIRRFGVLIIKDYEDMRGDSRYNIKTFPVLLGVKKAAHLELFCLFVSQAMFIYIAITFLKMFYIFPIVMLGFIETGLETWVLLAPVQRAMKYFYFYPSLWGTQMVLLALGLRGLF